MAQVRWNWRLREMVVNGKSGEGSGERTLSWVKVAMRDDQEAVWRIVQVHER